MTRNTSFFGTTLFHVAAALLASAFMVGISAGPAIAAGSERAAGAAPVAAWAVVADARPTQRLL
jgi:hypothetical protein